ncbi:MBG domain-containing protein [Arcobacter porcinus]|uniref:Hemagglutinin domain-containing protein n=1 Tax=Arcobacter porcinus TaxID=1935204 RepID=A0A5C2HCZ9_9BACT|nr:MBG domain-containing protein [Arcobacter porcinus]OCL86713.1 Heme/hemopexin-binding protein precursor [Aliarcobacter thereius]QEP40773.1 hemagglutinin domain-containing protein [Arcobacter porcinus]
MKKKIYIIILFLIINISTLYAAPQGANVVSGNVNINQIGNITNVNQTTNKAIVNWQSFSVGKNEVVNFNQPNINSSILNRVVGFDKSFIDGAINSNGKVFLVNPNGVVFSKDAVINVGGLVASTRDITNENFLSGNYVFEGSSSSGILNQGKILVANNSLVALLGQEVINEGVIAAKLGTIALASGDRFTLNLNGNSLTSLTIDKGTYNSLVSNRGLIEADGSNVFLTSKALDEVIKGVTNNDGIIEAKSILDEKGVVVLSGDSINVDGTIEASEIYAGSIKDEKTTIKSTATLKADFVETSGKTLSVENGATIQAKHWLIDPLDVTIDSGSGSIGGETVGASVIQSALLSGRVTIQANRDIFVNSNLTWSTNILDLHAGLDDNTGSIFVNAIMNASGSAGLDLKYGADGTIRTKMAANEDLFNPNSTVTGSPTAGFTGKINFSGSGEVWINGDEYTAVNSLVEFRAMNANGNYFLGSDFALGTGWTALASFSGNLEGFGHILTLTSTTNGLFTDITGNIRNMGLSGTINGSSNTIGYFGGTLNGNAKLENVYASGAITGKDYVGGLIGQMSGNSQIIHSYKSGQVNASGNYAGGLVASMAETSSVKNSYVWSDVKANNFAGGFVSYMADSSKIYDSKVGGNLVSTINQAYTGNTEPRAAGFVSWVNGAGVVIDNSHTYITNVNGGRVTGGFVGYLQDGTITDSSTSANVNGANNTNAYWIGGFAGYVGGDGTLKGNTASGNVKGFNTQVGGIAGFVHGSSTFENNHYLPTTTGTLANPNVQGTAQIGGLIGNAGAGLVIKDSSARGYIKGTGAGVGGLVGQTAGVITINDSWFGDFELVDGKLQFIDNKPKLLATTNITSEVYSTNYGVGGFIGWLNGTATINGGYISAKQIYGLRSTGGFVGESSGATTGLVLDKGTENSYIYIKDAIYVSNSIGRVGGVAGYINAGVSIKNLNLDINSIYSTGNFQHTAGLVGWKAGTTGDIVVENVNLTLHENLKGGQYLGGLFGQIASGNVSIKNTQVDLGNQALEAEVELDPNPNPNPNPEPDDENLVDGTTSYVGGLIGYLQGSGTVNIENVIVKAHSIKTNASNYIGGLIGHDSSSGAGTIKNTKVLLNPTAGFIGNNANNASYVGGLIGYANSIYEVQNSEVLVGTIRGSSYLGGLFGYVVGANISDTKVTIDTILGSSSYVGGFAGGVGNGGLTLAGANEVNANQIQGTYYVGGVAGVVTGATSIDGIKVTVANNILGTSHTSNNGAVGGLVGQANNALTIKNAKIIAENIYNSNTSARYIGGLVGYHNSTNQYTISDVEVTTSGAIGIKGYLDIGGLIGTTNTTNANNSITNAYVNSRLEGGFLGGLIGRGANSATAKTIIDSVYFKGDIVARNYNIGGLVGEGYSSPAYIVNNAWVGNYTFVIDSSTNSITSATANAENHSFTFPNVNSYIGGMFGEVGALTLTNAGVNLKGSLYGTHSVGGVAGNVNGNFVAQDVQVNIENDIYTTSVYTTSNTNTYYYDSFVGGLVGWLNNGSAVISNVVINARDFYGVNSGARSIGGLIGRQYGNYGFTIEDVKVNLREIKGSNFLGGLIGSSRENTQATNSIKNASVKLTNGIVASGNYAGGFISYIHNNSSLTIENSLYEGSIIGANAYYGGLVGNSGNLTVKNTVVGKTDKSNSTKGSIDLGGVVGDATGTLTLEKVTVNFADITGTSYRVGGVAGYVTGAFKADETTVNVNKIQGQYDVGGLVGRANNTTHIGTETGSTFGARVNTQEIIATANANHGLGGLVGYANGVVFIKNSDVVATIQIKANSGNYVGGLVGFMSLNTGYSIENASVTTPLIYGGTGVGGLLGYASNTGGTRTIANSHANVNLVEGTGNYVGGLIGNSAGAIAVNISNSSFVGGIKGKAEIGGLVGTLHSITNLTNVYAGNFTITTDATGAITDAVVNGSSNFTINSQNNSYVGGAIGYTSSALNANNVEINFDSISGNQYVGGFVGETRGAFTANGVKVTINGNITATNSSETNVGGLVGKTSGGVVKITNTDVEVDNIFALNGRVAGGLIGYQSGNYLVELENINVNFTKIEARNNSVAGLIAIDGSSNANNSIKNVSVNGDIVSTAGGTYIAGFIGNANGSYKVEDSHFEGKLLGNNSSSGGLFGKVTNLDVKDSSVKITSNITGTSYLGGLVGEAHGTIYKVTNSTFEFLDILGTSSYIGGLFAYMPANSLIEIDTVSVKGGTVQGTQLVGGLIGYTNTRNANNKILNTDVELTAVKATTLTTSYGTGGFVGHNYYTDQAYLVENSSFKGDVIGGEYVGGLFGYVGSVNVKDTTVETNLIKANKNYAGGIAGWVNNIFTAENVSVIGGGNIEAANYASGVVARANNFTASNLVVDLGNITATGTDSAGVITQVAGIVNINGADIKATLISSGTTTASGAVGVVNASGTHTLNNIKVEVGEIRATYPVSGILNQQNHSSSVVNITNSSFSGKLNQTGNNASYGSGGIVGTSSGTLNISDSFVGEFDIDGNPVAIPTTEIISVGQNLGGLVGLFTKGSLVDNHVAVKTLASTQSQVGGVVGKAAGTVEKTMSGNKVSLAEIKGASNVGGLVGLSEGGLNISNEILDGVNVSGTGNYVGGLVGQMTTSGTITNSTVKNSKIEGVDYVGGIVGYFAGTSMTSVFVLDHEHLKGNNYVGGVVGFTNKPITLSGSDADVVGVDFVGGFAGAVASGGNISQSYALGEISGRNQVGGFAGQVNAGKLTNVYAVEDVNGNAQVGGLVGYALGAFDVINSYSIGKVTGVDSTTTRGLIGQGTKAATNSFYLYEGNESLVQDTANVAKKENELKNGDILKSMGWDIVIDETLPVKLFPQLRWTCTGGVDFCATKTPQTGTTVWVVGYSKDLVKYELNDKTYTYDKIDRLPSAWNFDVSNGKLTVVTDSNSVLDISSWTYGTDYWFVDSLGNKIDSIINVADSKANIGLVIDHLDYMIDHRSTTTHTKGSLTITPAKVTVTANDYTKTYDGVAFTGGAGVTYQVENKIGDGLYTGDVLGGSLIYGGDSQGQKDVGVGEFEISPSGLYSTTGNYNVVFVEGKLIINKAELHVRADDAVKTYDGVAYNKAQEHATYSGFVGSEDETILGGALTYSYSKGGVDCTISGCVNAGVYDIALGGLVSNGNYTIVYDTAILTVNKANLTVSADDKIFQYVTSGGYAGYDATESGKEYTYKVNGFVNEADKNLLGGQNIDFDITKGGVHYNYQDTGNEADKPFNSGGYLISPKDFVADNYNITYIPGHLIISPNPVLLEAVDMIKNYDGHSYSASEFIANWYDANHALKGTYTGANSYTISITDNNTGLDHSFSFDFAGDAVGAKDVKYDGSGNIVGYEITFNATGLIRGDYDNNGDFIANPTDGQFWSVLDGSGASIIDVFFGAGALIVNRANLSAEVNNEIKSYNGSNQNYDALADITYNFGNVSAGIKAELDSLGTGTFTYTQNGNVASPKNAGLYSVNLDSSYFTDNGTFNPANYDITLLDGSLTIKKADLFFEANNETKTYDGSLYHDGNGVTYLSGLQGSDSYATVINGSLIYGGNAQNAKNVGTYTITASGYTADNYNIYIADGSLVINPATLTVKANDDSKTYNSLAYSGGNGVTYSGFVGDDTFTNALNVSALTYGGNSQGAIDANNYAITPSGIVANNGNYIITYVDGNLEVKKAALIVKADDHHTPYTGTAHNNPLEHTVTFSGFVNGETSSVLGGTLGFDFAGADSTVTNAGVYSMLPKGLISTNYDISYETGILEIDKVKVTVTSNNATETYKGDYYTAGYGVVYSGFVNSESETNSLVDISRLSYDLHGAKNVGTYNISASGLEATNYYFEYVDGTLTITKATLNATANDDTRTYNATAYTGGAGYSLSGFVGADISNPAGVIIDESTLVYSNSAINSVNVGNSYVIEISGLSSENYDFTYTPGNLTTNKAVIIAKANDETRVYNAQEYKGGAGYSIDVNQLFGSDTLSSIGLVDSALTYGGNSYDSKNVGTYDIEISGLSSTNYDFVYEKGDLTTTAKTLTVTANNDEKTYNGLVYSGAAGVSYSGFEGSDNEANALNISGLAYSGDSQSAINAGTYTISVDGITANSGNYILEYVDGTLTVKKATLTAKAKDDTIYYNATGYTGGAGYLLTGFVNSEDELSAGVVNSGLIYSGDAIGAKNAGTYTNMIEISGLYASNYDFSYDTGTLTINKAVVTIKADDVSKTYDGKTYLDGNNFTATYVGLQGGETASSLGLNSNIVYSGDATTNVNADIYDIEVSLADTTNYTFVADANKGKLTINKATLTVSASGETKEYDANVYSGGNGVTYSGFVNGETVSNLTNSTVTYTGDSQTAKNVGSYTITPSGLTADNYEFVYVDGTLKITPAQLTITADSKAKKYDGAIYSGGYSYSVDGLKVGDVLDETNKTYYIVKGNELYTEADAPSNAGVYKIQVTGLENSNYDITFVDGLLAIGNNPLVITATDVTKEYDGQNYTFTVDFSNINGAFSAVGWQGSDSWANLGKYQDNDTSNSKLEEFSMTFVIKKDGTVVTEYKNAGEYEINLEATTGFVLGDWDSVNPNQFNVDVNGTVMLSGDYEIHFAPGVLNIDKKSLDITVNNNNFTYNGQEYIGNGNSSLSSNGFILGEDFSNLIGNANFTFNGNTSAKNAGTYTMQVDGFSSDNYDIHYYGGTLVIDKEVLNVAVQNETKEYDSLAFNGGEIDVTGFVDGENISHINQSNLVFTGDSQGAINAGTYHIYASGLEADNYSFVYNTNAMLTVNKANLSVKVENQSKTYDSNSVTNANLTYTGLKGSDSVSSLDSSLLKFTFNGDSSALNAGTYEVIASGLDSNNYNITYVNGELVISKANLTVSVDNKSKVYDNSIYSGAYTVTYSGFAGSENETNSDLTGALAFGGDSQTAINAGTYSILASGYSSNNYDITYTAGSLIIEKAKVTVSANDDSKEYNGVNQSSSTGVIYQVDGKVGTGLYGTDSLGGWNLAYDGNSSVKDAGGYIISVNGASNNPNYEIIGTNDGHFVITPKALTITAENKNKVYDNSIYSGAYTVTYNGFVSGENKSNLDGNLAFVGDSQTAIDAGTYTITPLGLSSNNYVLTFVDGNLTIDKAKVTVSANNDSTTYNGLGQTSQTGVTYQVSGKTGTGLYGTDSLGGWSLAYGGNASATNAGVYTISVSGASDNANYEFVNFNVGNFTINKKDLTVSADDKTMMYKKDTYNGGYTLSYNGFVNGENETTSDLNLAGLTFGGFSQSAVNAGEYTIKASGISSNNYNISYEEGTLKITPAELDVTVSSVTSVYNGGTVFTQSGGATVTLSNGGGSAYDNIDTFIYQHHNKDVGTYNGVLTVIGVDNANYIIKNSSAGNVVITKADLVIKANNKEKYRDGKIFNGSYSATYNGLQGNDTIYDAINGNINYIGNALNAVNVGEYIISIDSSNLSSHNYNLIFEDGLLKIENKIEPWMDSLISSIKNGSATINKSTSFDMPLERSTTRLMSMSEGVKTVVVDFQTIKKASKDLKEIKIPLGRNSKIDLVNGGVKLPLSLNQEFYLELQPDEDINEAIKDILDSKNRI